MSRVWFAQDLETVAMFWRVARADGVTLGFTTHDADLWFDGLLHRAVPGIVPSAIRRSADLEPDSAEVQGALDHAAISTVDLSAGRFDAAQVRIGLVDWQSGETQPLYRGTIGAVSEEGGRFTATLTSRKAELQRDTVPRTSPTCRAGFCGPGCGLSAARFTARGTIAAVDLEANSAVLSEPADISGYAGGWLRWRDGPLAGLSAGIVAVEDGALVLGAPLDIAPPAGTRVILREGCDRTLATCAGRFANAVNFRGEPFLPGNDRVARYPSGLG